VSDDVNEEIGLSDLKKNQHWIGFILILAGLVVYLLFNNFWLPVIIGGLGLLVLGFSEPVREKIKQGLSELSEEDSEEFSLKDLEEFYKKHENSLYYVALGVIVLVGFFMRISLSPNPFTFSDCCLRIN